MLTFLQNRFRSLKLRWKLLLAVLPLVILPIIITGSLVGYISAQQAYQGITERSKSDLDHMAEFTVDLLDAQPSELREAAVSFPGKWLGMPPMDFKPR